MSNVPRLELTRSGTSESGRRLRIDPGSQPGVFVIGRSPEVRTRLRCMRKYTCFRGAAWQKEFDRYEKQGGFVDLRRSPPPEEGVAR